MYHFTIKDLENLSGIKAHTIRIWEKRYSFLNPERSNTNIRFYSTEELKTLLDVSLLNKYGFKISGINKLTKDDLRNAIAGLKEPQAQHENIIHQLLLHMIYLAMDAFENALNSYIKINSIAECISNIIYPLLQKVNLLRNEGNLNIECEKLLSNIVRQKIIGGIEQQNNLQAGNETIITFLPEGEHYEIELLYMQFIMKSEGLGVIYLGANVPAKDVIKIALYKKPDYIHTHLNNTNHQFNTEKYLEKLSRLFHEFTVIVTGMQLQDYKKKIPGNIRAKFLISNRVF